MLGKKQHRAFGIFYTKRRENDLALRNTLPALTQPKLLGSVWWHHNFFSTTSIDVCTAAEKGRKNRKARI